ncbi:hypothetical protein PUW24_20490 [Paenibacillus urinalis]|uniref:YD repeat-containing protein n=1 Tax=Paenibacillus urinalis TaxID=521520 RepID=A0AAX3MTV4_9BACL|nr:MULTISPECIES: hypothetical protein [Paenibacillus]WDH80483.1 hypothetical protein PUW23_12985 [Paenibacillus urinalis]WDH96524.1 hypothetical protein PUW24_20490 [Paenibacillus urinalis]WDI00170.1 hypothetical protein PUW25_12655 [Paenibacillus urinalis]GAK40665.1 hypothetical protein TCA2_3155 [Paenibacillus sp. TCA20]
MKHGKKKIVMSCLILSLLSVVFVNFSNNNDPKTTSSTAFATENTQNEVQTYQYDSMNRLKQLTFYKDGVKYTRNYIYDDNGNTKSVTTTPAP